MSIKVVDSKRVDTDNDGVPDGMELNWNNDTDGDGKIIECNLDNGTDPDIVIKFNDGINALEKDSDNDSISDGVEMGVTGGVIRSGKDHSALDIGLGNMSWTNNKKPHYETAGYYPTSNYEEDLDPSTITNMTLEDTDSDGRTDYQEDTNANGQQDQSESDPLDMDTDDDGLMDGHSFECGGAMKDSDGDGVYNCLDPDSDDDGLYDGLEAGVTVPIQGNDEIEGTDIDAGYFIRDIQPLHTTDPLDPDTDGDGRSDGVEDQNHNGGIDWQTDETDPNDVDTDDDGLYDGSTNNTFGDPGEDSDNDGTVDEGESDPNQVDTDGDTLWDGDEVNPEDIELDLVKNRYNPDDNNVWYDSDPTKRDTDGDGYEDDRELRGWDVRIFWEATLETMVGPYEVYSDPDDNDTDDDNLDDLLESRYFSDPHKQDTDDDNTNDGQEVIDGDCPTGIEGKSPDVKYLSLSATPIVKESSGLYFLKGWKVKLNIKIEDSSGPYFIKFQQLNGNPVQKFLQGTDEEYYVTDLIAEIELEVMNNGEFDYASAFHAYIEDSVGNNVSVNIVGGGLPSYTNDELKDISENGLKSSHVRSIEEVVWSSENGTAEINVEGLEWQIRRISSIYESQLEKLFLSDNDDYVTEARKFFLDFVRIYKQDDLEDLHNFFVESNILDIDISHTESSRSSHGSGTPSSPPSTYVYHFNGDLMYDYDYLYRKIAKDNDPFADKDGDFLLNGEEAYFGTEPGNPDSDGDGLTDCEEVGYRPNDMDIAWDNVDLTEDGMRSIGFPIGHNQNHMVADSNAEGGEYYRAIHPMQYDWVKLGFYLPVQSLITIILYAKLDDSSPDNVIGKTLLYLDHSFVKEINHGKGNWQRIFIDLGYLDADTHNIKLSHGGMIGAFIAWDHIEIASRVWTDPNDVDGDTDDDGLLDGVEVDRISGGIIYRANTLINKDNFWDPDDIAYFGINSYSVKKIEFNTWQDCTKPFLPIIFNTGYSFSLYYWGVKHAVTIFKNIYLDIEKIGAVNLRVSTENTWIDSKLYAYVTSMFGEVITSIELQIQAYSNPLVEDTDSDGLDDYFETTETDTSGNGWADAYIIESEKPNPVEKDIYVEVDWMKRDEWVFNPLLQENEHIVCEHKMSSEAKEAVIYRFREHGISLHIDDGTGDWSGGTNVPHRDYTFAGNKDDNENRGLSGGGEYNDIMDFVEDDSDYFESSRHRIFHYVLSAHYYSKNRDLTIVWNNDEVEGSHCAGTGEGAGVPSNLNPIILGDSEISNSNRYAFVLMHELGHTFHLSEGQGGANSCMIGSNDQLTYGDAWDDLELDFRIG